jgi:hypothetical protein
MISNLPTGLLYSLYERIHTICLRVIGIAFSGVAREGGGISWKRKGLGGADFRTTWPTQYKMCQNRVGRAGRLGTPRIANIPQIDMRNRAIARSIL